MTNVVEFTKPDSLGYITDKNGKPVGVETKGFSVGREVNSANINLWKSAVGTTLSVDEFNQICIAWLALHLPDVLRADKGI